MQWSALELEKSGNPSYLCQPHPSLSCYLHTLSLPPSDSLHQSTPSHLDPSLTCQILPPSSPRLFTLDISPLHSFTPEESSTCNFNSIPFHRCRLTQISSSSLLYAAISSICRLLCLCKTESGRVDLLKVGKKKIYCKIGNRSKIYLALHSCLQLNVGQMIG